MRVFTWCEQNSKLCNKGTLFGEVGRTSVLGSYWGFYRKHLSQAKALPIKATDSHLVTPPYSLFAYLSVHEMHHIMTGVDLNHHTGAQWIRPIMVLQAAYCCS